MTLLAKGDNMMTLSTKGDNIMTLLSKGDMNTFNKGR